MLAVVETNRVVVRCVERGSGAGTPRRLPSGLRGIKLLLADLAALTADPESGWRRIAPYRRAILVERGVAERVAHGRASVLRIRPTGRTLDLDRETEDLLRQDARPPRLPPGVQGILVLRRDLAQLTADPVNGWKGIPVDRRRALIAAGYARQVGHHKAVLRVVPTGKKAPPVPAVMGRPKPVPEEDLRRRADDDRRLRDELEKAGCLAGVDNAAARRRRQAEAEPAELRRDRGVEVALWGDGRDTAEARQHRPVAEVTTYVDDPGAPLGKRRVRLSAAVGVLQHLLARRVITGVQYRAGRRFKADFDRAHWNTLAAVDPAVPPAGRRRGPDRTDDEDRIGPRQEAGNRLWRLFTLLGGITAPAVGIAIDILGQDMTIREFTERAGWWGDGGSDRGRQRIKRVMLGTLDVMASFYQMETPRVSVLRSPPAAPGHVIRHLTVRVAGDDRAWVYAGHIETLALEKLSEFPAEPVITEQAARWWAETVHKASGQPGAAPEHLVRRYVEALADPEDETGD